MNLLTNKSPESIPENDIWMFRYEADTYYNYNVTLTCKVYIISSRTLKGVWVVPTWVDLGNEEDIKLHRKFVLNGVGKRFAYPTRDLAKYAFLCRKRRHIEILKSQLNKAESAYIAAGGKLPLTSRTFGYHENY
jgi:hypothetical protein